MVFEINQGTNFLVSSVPVAMPTNRTFVVPKLVPNVGTISVFFLVGLNSKKFLLQCTHQKIEAVASENSFKDYHISRFLHL